MWARSLLPMPRLTVRASLPRLIVEPRRDCQHASAYEGRLDCGRRPVTQPGSGPVDYGRGPRCVGRHSARRLGRGDEPGPDRKGPHCHQRRHRPVPSREPGRGPVLRHLHAPRLLDRPAHRRGTPDRRHRDAQRRDARRWLAGDDYGGRRDAGRRRAERRSRPAHPRRRGRGRAAGVPRLRQPAGDPVGHPGQRHPEQRHRPRHDLLHLPRWPQQRRHRADRRHERRLGVQRRRRRRLRLRHRRCPGSAGHRGRRPRRGRSRRPGIQPHPQDRRQRLQRHLLRQHRRRVVAGQQRRRRAEIVRHPEPGRHHPQLGHQRRGGRADHEGQGLVLHHRADLR